jgi:hypothetical protein
MKEKIEALIREIGINEVESILKQMKSKDNVKENLKKDFIDLLNGCTISFFCDDIDYRQDGKLICYYNRNENVFRLLDGIWLKLESKYNLNYQEMKELLAGIVEEVLNYKGVTPNLCIFYKFVKWKRY